MLVSAEPSPQLPAGEVASEEIKGHNILLPNLLSITSSNFKQSGSQVFFALFSFFFLIALAVKLEQLAALFSSSFHQRDPDTC